MSEVVFILGAGASHKAGVPLMSNFLDVAHDLWKMGYVSDAERSFEAVFNGISALKGVHSNSQLDIHNVESVFAAFEMIKTLGNFERYDTPEKIDGLISAMKTVIVKTIEETFALPASGPDVQAPPPYDSFTAIVRFLREDATPPRSVSVITFNYDMALDYAFYRNQVKVDYALDDEGPVSGIPLLKLHGSLNWAHCSGCKCIAPWPLESYLSQHQWDTPLLYALEDMVQSFKLSIGSNIGEFEHCGFRVRGEPVIVPPTWNKSDYHRDLSPVWSRAAKELHDAEYIFVIGYSLPPSDAFFRYLYALGTAGEGVLKRFWVFDPDPEVGRRFCELLGPGALQRFRSFHKTSGTFEEAIDTVLEAFPTPRQPGNFLIERLSQSSDG